MSNKAENLSWSNTVEKILKRGNYCHGPKFIEYRKEKVAN